MKIQPVFVAALPLLLLLSGCGAKPIAAPASFEPFVAIDKSFAGVGPVGWEKGEFGGGETYAKTAWASGNAKIEVKSDTANSFLGGAAALGGRKPVDVIHEKILAALTADMPDFAPQTTQTVTSAWGDARLTEWTSGTTHGLRGTAMALDRSIGLNCQCPEADWETLKPAFMKVWTELKAGPPA